MEFGQFLVDLFLQAGFMLVDQKADPFAHQVGPVVQSLGHGQALDLAALHASA